MAKKGTILIEFVGKDLVGRTVNGIKKQLTGLKKFATSVHGTLVGLGAAVAGSALTRYLVGVNREYGVLLSQLQTLEGSRGAALAVFKDIEKMAASTPFQIDELTKAYITLKAAGIQPSLQMLTRFGDIAASMGGRIDDFAEAVRGALTGETERLKAFNVTAQIQGAQLALTYRGATTVIGRNAQELTGYLEKLGETDFAGGMERQSRTLDGAISNLQDSFDTLARSIGDAGLTGDLIDLAQWMSRVAGEANGNAAEFEGWYKQAKALAEVVGKTLRAAWVTLVGPIALVSHLIFAILGGFAAMSAGFKNKEANEYFKRHVEGLKADVQWFVDAYGDVGRAASQVDRVRASNRNRRADMDRDSLGTVFQETGGPKGLDRATDPAKQPSKSTGNAFGAGKEKDPDEQILKEAAALSDLVRMGKASEEQIAKLTLMQHGLAAKAAEANVPVEKQVDLLKAAADAGEALNAKKGTSTDPWAVLDQRNAAAGAAARSAGITRSIASSDFSGAGALFQPSFTTQLGSTIGTALDGMTSLQDQMEDITRNTVTNFGDAMVQSFEAIITGSGNAADAFKDAMVGAVMDVARAKGMAELAEAFSALGSGFMGHPGAFASFANHMKSATLWFALAGGAAAAMGGGASGGRSGAVRDARGFSDVDRGSATLIIKGGLLDMSDPRQERALADALEELSGRRVIITRG